MSRFRIEYAISFKIPKKDVTPAQSIPIMTNFVVNPDMELHVEYGTTDIESYRTVTHDVIKIYGFRFKNNVNGQIKAKFIIEDGLRKRVGLRIISFKII